MESGGRTVRKYCFENADSYRLSMTRIFLYSSEPVLARGFSSALIGNNDLCLVGVATGTDNLAIVMATEKPDILLLDLTTDVSFELLRELRKRTDSCRILLWVNTISTELAFQAMGLGVRGIVRKTLPAETLFECLRKVNEGELWFEKTLTDSMLFARKVSLTRREGQLVTLLTQGLKNKEIATVLCVCENTVKVYLSRLYQKVSVKDRFELALYGLRNVAAGERRWDQTAQPSQGFEGALKTPRVEGLRSLLFDGPQNPSPSGWLSPAGH
jgi:DNA-binding NarL/FixJ family response regulator